MPILNQTTLTTVTGTAKPNALIEIFSDPDDEGLIYEGHTTSDSVGNFTFHIEKGLAGPNVTATATDASGNTSGFSGTIQGVNDRPVIVQSMNDITLQEDFNDRLIATNLYDFFSDTPPETLLVFSASSRDSLTNPIIRNDSLLIASIFNLWGEDEIIVTATDIPGLSVRDTFNITITPINDSPEFINLPDTVSFMNNETDSLFVWDFVEDPETHDSLLVYEFVTGCDSLLLDYYTETGYLILSAESGFSGQTDLSLSVTDDSGSVAHENMIIKVYHQTGMNIFQEQAPLVFKIYQNYPNPFNPETTIHYDVPKYGPVKIAIYNILGQRIRTLVDEIKNTGSHEVVWNARNDHGEVVTSGVYFIQLESAINIDVIKVVLLQ